MPQEMNVMCCYSCKMYQVQIVKKAPKWQCRMCNQKQSVRQVYFEGSGKDCRLYVQRMNYLQATLYGTSDPISSVTENNDSNYFCDVSANISKKSDNSEVVESKRAKYCDSPKEENPSDNEDVTFNNIREIEDATSKKSLCNDIRNDSSNFEKTIEYNFDFETDVTDNYEVKKSHYEDSNDTSNTDDKCNLQCDSKYIKDHNDDTNIYETYDELDDPIDF